MNAASAIVEDPRSRIGSVPISAEQPAGTDIRSSPEFDVIDGEIRKLDSDGPNAVDWGVVADQGLHIVEHRSKDILVGAWLAYALHRREGIAGLGVGLRILRGIVSDHWDGAAPPAKRERARTAPFDWLVGRTASVVAEAAYADADAPALMLVLGTLNDIDEAMTARLKKEAVQLGELMRAVRPHADAARRALEEASRRLEGEVSRAAEQAEAARRAAAVEALDTQKRASAAPMVAPAAASLTDFDSLPEVLWAQARHVRERDIRDPRSYMIGRLGSWLRIDDLPTAQGATTFVVRPAALDSFEGDPSGRAEQILQDAEMMVWDSPFALDVHRYSHEMLGLIGGEVAAAQAAIQGQLSAFLSRFPSSRSLAFSDGSPFADEATLALAGGGPTVPAAADPMERAVEDAQAMMRAGRSFEAHAALAEALRGATSGRQRARWQVAQARFCLDNGYAGAALPLLDHLDRLIEDRDLEAWEPEFSAAVAELRVRALTQPGAQSFEEGHRACLNAARGRLARLDIAAAIRLLAV